jgi:hypothetical protein
MQRNTTTPSLGEVASELGSWMVGAGIVTTMLFPFMVPILLLTAAAVLPLLAPVLVLAVFAAPVVIARAATRAVRRAHGRRSEASATGYPQRSGQNEALALGPSGTHATDG